jgi:hypothetical protein
MVKTLAIALVFVSTAAFAASQKLSGNQIQQHIIGNTLAGTENGSPYFEYFAAYGVIMGRGKDGEYLGNWTIRGDKLCVAYEDDNGNIAGIHKCSYIFVNGRQVTGSSIDEDDPLTIEQGNPRNLTVPTSGDD